jgi:hypothetical protein
MPQNMYSLLIQDVLVNGEKYANAYKSDPYKSATITHSNQFIVHIFTLLKVWNNFLG